MNYDLTVFKIASRNLWRRKIRTSVVVLMISVGLAGLIFVSGLYDGMAHQMVRDTIQSEAGHVSIFGKGFRLSQKLKDAIEKSEWIEHKLNQTSYVEQYIKRLKIDGMISSARYSQGVQIIGIEPDRERQFGHLHQYIVEGKYSFDSKRKEIVLGADLADKLKVRLGQKIVLMGQAQGGSIASGAFRVAGILRANNMQLDRYAGFVPLDQLQKIFGVGSKVTQIMVKLNQPEQLEENQQQLDQLLKDSPTSLEILSWKEMFPLMKQMEEVIVVFNLVSYIIVFLAVAIGIFNIVLISVLERVREFGIMLAIGTQFRQIAQIVFLESLIMGFFGLMGGSFLGYFLLIYFGWFGLDLSAFAPGFNLFGMASIMYPAVQSSYFIWAVIAVCLTSFISVLWPIRILRKLNPVQSINFT